MDLRETKNLKLKCGDRHFAGCLGVDYKVVSSTEQID